VRKENIRPKPIHSSQTAKEVVVKNVCTTTLSGAPVTAICDPATVRSYLLFLLSDVWVNSWFADCIDLDGRRVHMSEWSFPANCSWGANM